MGAEAREAVWRERLARRLPGVNPNGPLVLTPETTRLSHELLKVSASPYKYDGDEEWQQEVERLADELRQATERAEDEKAAELGLPPRPR
jgi:hypothetical protein